MYKLVVLFLFVLSINAMADSPPSNLPDGKYAMDCQVISVQKYDRPVPGAADDLIPAGADSNGITRNVEYQRGTSLHITSGNSTTIKDVYSIQSDDFSGEGETLTQQTVTSVGDNRFEEAGTRTDTMTINDKNDPIGHTSTGSYTWKRTFSVQGNFEINLKIQNGDQPEAPGRGERIVTKHSDGSFTVSEYIREGFHRDRKEHKDGSYSLASFIIQASSVCIYTPSK